MKGDGVSEYKNGQMACELAAIGPDCGEAANAHYPDRTALCVGNGLSRLQCQRTHATLYVLEVAPAGGRP